MQKRKFLLGSIYVHLGNTENIESATDVLTGQGHFVTSHLGDNMASVTWATKVSTKWVDQIDQLLGIFEEINIFVVWLGRFAPFAK